MKLHWSRAALGHLKERLLFNFHYSSSCGDTRPTDCHCEQVVASVDIDARIRISAVGAASEVMNDALRPFSACIRSQPEDCSTSCRSSRSSYARQRK
jgi:hypothetical protein